MTDTNQASELYELCKEVYERTKWDNYCEYWSFGGEYTVNKDLMTSIEVETAIIPLYTSDYLLEKLPKKYNNGILLLAITNSTQWGAEYYSFYPPERGAKTDVYISDTPLKALLKLTIALSEAGELK